MVSNFLWVYSNSIASADFTHSRHHTPYNTHHPYGYKYTSSLGSFRHLRFGASFVSFVIRSFVSCLGCDLGIVTVILLP